MERSHWANNKTLWKWIRSIKTYGRLVSLAYWYQGRSILSVVSSENQIRSTMTKCSLNFSEIFLNPETGYSPRKPGSIIKPPQTLCLTYRLLAQNGGKDFYTGQLAEHILADLRDMGSVITRRDLELYRYLHGWDWSNPYLSYCSSTTFLQQNCDKRIHSNQTYRQRHVACDPTTIKWPNSFLRIEHIAKM